MVKFKILLLNIGYLTGLNGSLFDYLFKGYRYIIPSRKSEEKIIANFKKMIAEEKPDLICLIEIRKNQINKLADKKYHFYNIETKYGEKSILKKIPILKNQCNGFISKKKLNFNKFYLKEGTKKFVYEIILPNKMKLIMFHFALRKKIREMQFNEINQFFRTDKYEIICGDFNLFGGFQEIKEFIKENNLQIMPNEPTFPTFNPDKILDLFLCSNKLKANSRVLNEIKISDHLPVILELNLNK